MNNKKIIFIFSIILLMGSCDISRQINEMNAFSKCDFRLYTIEDIKLAGVDIQQYKSYKDLKFMDIATISTSLAKGNLPLTFTLNVQVKNPNPATAALNKMEWILFIDEIEILQGVSNQRAEIPPNGGISNLPLQINADLMKVLSGESAEAVSNFAFNLAGQGNRPSRIMLKVKPAIMVGNTPVSYPGYISVKNEFTSN
ncbi:MAG: hypothetical protein K8S00_00115 [Bacteroidales bacterium]|nr:hypothetical protein [Bacteroidales bacterium]